MGIVNTLPPCYCSNFKLAGQMCSIKSGLMLVNGNHRRGLDYCHLCPNSQLLRDPILFQGESHLMHPPMQFLTPLPPITLRQDQCLQWSQTKNEEDTLERFYQSSICSIWILQHNQPTNTIVQHMIYMKCKPAVSTIINSLSNINIR